MNVAALKPKTSLLAVLVATHNRLPSLKRALSSISAGTRCPHDLIVIDGGSTDGTIDFLRSQADVRPVFQQRLYGSARTYNAVWREVEAKHTCWLSDDTEILPGSLDLAVRILEEDPTIGMVGLKMKDTVGPFKGEPYLGGVSEYGILNCNHGVVRFNLLRAIGYFNEAYRSYTVDADLTASILCTGKVVVLTKQVSVLHHRGWAEGESVDFKLTRDMGGIDNARIYHDKFRFLEASMSPSVRLRGVLRIGSALFRRLFGDTTRFGFNRRDWHNLALARFVPLSDPLRHRKSPYHFVQRIPDQLLRLEANPYCDLVDAGGEDIGSRGAAGSAQG